MKETKSLPTQNNNTLFKGFKEGEFHVIAALGNDLKSNGIVKHNSVIELIDKTKNSLSVSNETEWECLYYTNKNDEVLSISNSFIEEIAEAKRLKGCFKRYINVKGTKAIYFYHPTLIEAVANQLKLTVNHITLEVAMGRWYNNIIDCSDEES